MRKFLLISIVLSMAIVITSVQAPLTHAQGSTTVFDGLGEFPSA